MFAPTIAIIGIVTIIIGIMELDKATTDNDTIFAVGLNIIGTIWMATAVILTSLPKGN